MQNKIKQDIEDLQQIVSDNSSAIGQLMNDWDFGLITSSPTSFDDFGSIV